MRALRFNEYGQPLFLKLEQIPKPQQYAGEVLVKVEAAGINRSDVIAVAGGFKSSLPRTPGRDFAGVIVDGWDAGLEVWGSGAGFGVTRDGAHADFVAIPRAWLCPKPHGLSMAQAAASGVPFIVAFDALVTAGAIQKGETLLVSGSEGAVGRAAAQIAHWRGARVIGVQRSPNPSGADDIVDTITEDLNQAVETLTKGAGVDIALDAVGGDLFEPMLKSLRPGGRQISIARGSRPRVELNLRDFFHNRTTLHGVDTSGLSGERVVEILQALRSGFEQGALSALETWEAPLARAVDSYQAVVRGARERQILTFD